MCFISKNCELSPRILYAGRLTHMKIAIVHELLTMKGGAERVLRIIADLFPGAPIYTLLYNEKKLGTWFPKERVRPAAIPAPYSLLPAPYRYNHHLLLPVFPKMVKAWDFSEFDIVLSTSSAFTHGIITNSQPRHLCYVHSPARYLWDRTHDVLDQAGHGILGPLKQRYLEHQFHKLRVWDSEAADRPDALLAASKEVQRRIELYWRRTSDVTYPPIDNFWTESRVTSQSSAPYFFIASTLVPYKQIEIAIDACNALQLPLKIAGEGPDKKRLQKISGSTIEFLGYIEREQLREYFSSATAVLFPGKEDFGLVPVEAMACGTPVIAQRSGGALETIIEGETGAFFDKPTSESLQQVLSSFDKNNFDADVCKKRAAEFSQSRFEEQIKNAVHTLYENIAA